MRRVQDEFKKCLLVVAMGLSLAPCAYGSARVEGRISKIGDATHLEFEGLSDWKYDIRREGGHRVKVQLPAFNKKTATLLKTWQGPFIKEVSINEQAPDGQFEVTFVLHSSEVEHFDYLTDEPSRLIIDFFKQTEKKEPVTPKVATSNSPAGSKSTKGRPRKQRTPPPKNKIATNTYEKKDYKRNPAGSELMQVDPKGPEVAQERPEIGVYDGGDPNFDRFRIKDYEIKEESVIGSRQNIYIPFPMLKMPTSQLSELVANPPEYVIKPRDDRENKEARLLVTLYDKNRNASFLKVYKYFTKKYPNSVYDELVRNMAAEVHYRLWERDKNRVDLHEARSIYRSLVHKYPDSPLAERADLIVAYSTLEEGRGLESIQEFQRLIKKYPKSSEVERLKNSLADSFLILNKFDEAQSLYEDIKKTGRRKLDRIEASYRMGDVDFQRKAYAQAIKKYQQALKEYPENKRQFPNALYNMAESYFWLGRHKESLDAYVDYIQNFPAHDHGGYAITRIGELLDILGADNSRVMGAFLESYFRFRESQGAEVARIRLLSQRMRGMKDKELTKALSEMKSIAENSDLPRMPEFATLMTSDGLQRRQEYDDALNHLISYYQKHPTTADFKVFQKRILGNIADALKKSVEQGDFFQALKLHGRYANTWLKSDTRFDIPYFMGRSYELAGVLDEAEKIYQRVLIKLNKSKGTSGYKEREVNEHLPSEEALNLRLASVLYNKRRYPAAYKYLGAIKNDKHLAPQERVERVDLISKVAEHRGDAKTAVNALEELIKAWEEKPELLGPAYVRLAGLQHQSGEHKAALQAIHELENLEQMADLPADVRAQTLRLKGDVLLAQHKPVAAVDAYLSLLKEFEHERPLGAVRYKAGEILFARGDLKGAERIWGLLGPDAEMYKSLAQEKIRHANWKQDYNKYIDRIPAAVDLK